MHKLCAPVPFSPNLPDVSAAQAERSFCSDTCVAVFIRNVKPWASRLSDESLLSYPFVLLVLKPDLGPIYFVTLEESSSGSKHLGVFDGTGAHLNYGSDESLNEDWAFVRRALSITEEEIGESFVEVLPRQANSTSPNSF